MFFIGFIHIIAPFTVKLPQQELGASFSYKRKTSLSPSGCRCISRQESGVLCGSIKSPSANAKGLVIVSSPYWTRLELLRKIY